MQRTEPLFSPGVVVLGRSIAKAGFTTAAGHVFRNHRELAPAILLELQANEREGLELSPVIAALVIAWGGGDTRTVDRAIRAWQMMDCEECALLAVAHADAPICGPCSRSKVRVVRRRTVSLGCEVAHA